jgi:hypothetical protein
MGIPGKSIPTRVLIMQRRISEISRRRLSRGSTFSSRETSEKRLCITLTRERQASLDSPNASYRPCPSLLKRNPTERQSRGLTT